MSQQTSISGTTMLVPAESVLLDLFRIIESRSDIMSQDDLEESIHSAACHLYTYQYFEQAMCIKCIDNNRVLLPKYKKVLFVLYKECDDNSAEQVNDIIKTTNTSYVEDEMGQVTDKVVYSVLKSASNGKWKIAYPGHSVYAMAEMCDEGLGLTEKCTVTYSLKGENMTVSEKSGYVIVFYDRLPRDEHGKLLIPDVPMVFEAIRTYVMWEIKERESFMHREGAERLAQKYFERWEKQAAVAQVTLMMPSLPEYIMMARDTNRMLKNDPYESIFFNQRGPENIYLGNDADYYFRPTQ